MYTRRERFTNYRHMVRIFGHYSAFMLVWEVRGDRRRRGQ